MASEQAKLYHSVEFGDKNTWDDWYLVPTNRPIVNPPTQKTQIIDIPGADGLLDISESLTGYPIYNNREGSIEFYVMNDYPEYRWTKVYSDILQHVHGKELDMILDDEPEYFYHGRFAVSDWKTEKERSRVTIAYSVEPYKRSMLSSIDNDWVWDSFNFNTDSINESVFKDIELTSSTEWNVKNFTYNDTNYAPICPCFIVDTTDSGIDLYIKNNTTGSYVTSYLIDGENQSSNIMFFGGDIEIGLKGNGTVNIVFRKGRL